MCHASDAAPPAHGAPLSAAKSRVVELTSADGAAFAGYLAEPERVLGASVLVLPDNRGLSGFYERLAVRLAEQGHPALAIDYYGRSAGLGHRERGASFGALENLMPHLLRLTQDGLCYDFTAGADALRQLAAGPVVSLGCCVGGRFAFLTSAPRFGLAGAIGLYGSPDPDPIRGNPGPTQRADEFAAPILGLFGGADEGIPASSVERFDLALSAAGVEHEFVSYPGAPHGFFESERDEFADACADVWRRVLAFLAARSG